MLGKLIFLIVLAGIGALFLGVKSYNFRGTWHEPFAPAYQADLSGSHLVGKTVVLTGGNTGIGKEMVSALLSMGANVFVGCRSIDRCQKAYDNEIRAQAGELALRRRSSTSVGQFQALSLDLASFKSVRNFVSELNKQAPGSSDVLPIDILVDNAAVANNNTGRTVDGLGEVMGTNHFGVFLLTRLLVPNLAAAGRTSGSKSRVVVVSSEAHTHATLYDLDDLSCKGEKHHGILAAFAVYGQSKLSNIFMAREFADRFKQHNLPITANAVHPGFIKTDLARSIPGSWRWVHETISSLLAMNAWDGAQNTLHLAVSPDLAHISGEYYDRFSITAPQLGPYHQLIQKILWDRSSEITGVSKDF